jgi:hypothetical protein
VSPRPLVAIGVDPGVGDPTAVVIIGEPVKGIPEVLWHHVVKHPGREVPITQQPFGAQLLDCVNTADRVWTAIMAAEMAANTEPWSEGFLGVAVDGYADIGKGMARGRFLVPMMVAALHLISERETADRIADDDPMWSRNWAYQSPAIVSHYRTAIRPGRQSRAGVLDAMDRQLCRGWSTLTTEHERVAGAHALHLLGAMRAERRHLTARSNLDSPERRGGPIVQGAAPLIPPVSGLPTATK